MIIPAKVVDFMKEIKDKTNSKQIEIWNSLKDVYEVLPSAWQGCKVILDSNGKITSLDIEIIGVDEEAITHAEQFLNFIKTEI